MYSFILGFQRLVWCPKWTPASSNSFMVMLANQPPHLVCIFRIPCGCSRLPFPSPHARYGKNLTPVSCFQLLVSSPETRNQKLDTALPLAVLESLSRAFLSILLAFFGARVPANQSLGLKFLAQLGIEQHERTSDAKLHRIGLAVHSASGNPGDDIEPSGRVGRQQRLLGCGTLRRRHEILFKWTPVNLELTAARTQIDARDCRLAASRTVILHKLCH